MSPTLLLLAAWAMVPSTSASAEPAEMARLMVLNPADAERHFITTFNDGPFALFAEDVPPPALEAPVETLPDLGAAPFEAAP